MRTLMCLTLLLLVSLVPPHAFAAATGTVNGTVTGADGKPSPNTKVRIRKVFGKAPVGKDSTGQASGSIAATLTTDKDGKFTQTLDVGEYWAEAGSKTLGYAKERFEVKAGETCEVKLTLAKS